MAPHVPTGSITVCLSTKTLYHPDAGGQYWVYLNWALGLRAIGCRVIWLESVIPTDPMEAVLTKLVTLKNRLAPYGFAASVALCSWTNEPLPFSVSGHCLPPEVASEADLLLNLAYGLPDDLVKSVRRSALVDIDPGLTQIWMSQGQLPVPTHDVYFTIGETVGQPGALFPDCGLSWQYTPPAVFLPAWPPTQADSAAPFTTVTNW